MNYKNYLFLLLSLSFFQPILAKISFEGIKSKISNMFSRQTEEIIHKQFPINKNGILSLENIQGNITIKTEWKQNYIMLKATKQISKKENLKNIDITIHKEPSKNQILVKTEYKNKNKTGSVDYELIVPNNITVDLKTKKGSIKIKRIKGKIKATSDDGDIKIIEAKGPIVAHTLQGNIEVHHSLKSIHAQAESGNILVACKKIPSIHQISLQTKKGNIAITLPEKTNAEIKAKTKTGKVTSDHFITLKPQTVTLNKKTWARFKKEVYGTLGSGEATIELGSNHGNIKISRAKTLKNNQKANKIT